MACKGKTRRSASMSGNAKEVDVMICCRCGADTISDRSLCKACGHRFCSGQRLKQFGSGHAYPDAA